MVDAMGFRAIMHYRVQTRELAMSMFTSTKLANANDQMLINAYLASNAITLCRSGAAKGARLPRTKHAGKPNYGMKARRYA